MIRDFTFAPFIGALPITFEMKAQEVSRILGTPELRGPNLEGEAKEIREFITITYSPEDQRVSDISFRADRGCSLSFEGADILALDAPQEFLRKYDAQPWSALGFLVFNELGLVVTGYQENADYKSITVFRRGRWDGLADEFERLSD